MTRVEIEDLRVSYGKADVLHGIDLSLAERGCTVLLGANGAGKTTLLRAMSGLVAYRGRIRIDDTEITRLAPARIAALGVAHVPQGRGTIGELTVEENLLVGGFRVRKRAARRKRLTTIYEMFPILAERRMQKSGQLSGGEQQMLAIGRALMPQPTLLLLDEPSLGLAPLVVEDLFASLRLISRNTDATVLLVEQNAKHALELADEVAVLEAGTLAAEGSVETIRNDDVLRAAYLGRAVAAEIQTPTTKGTRR